MSVLLDGRIVGTWSGPTAHPDATWAAIGVVVENFLDGARLGEDVVLPHFDGDPDTPNWRAKAQLTRDHRPCELPWRLWHILARYCSNGDGPADGDLVILRDIDSGRLGSARADQLIVW